VSVLSRPKLSTGEINCFYRYIILSQNNFFWYNMVKVCVRKDLLFYYCVLSLCIVTCKVHHVSYIIILCIVIVSHICNEENSTIINV
jgi:hypothetical protein